MRVFASRNQLYVNNTILIFEKTILVVNRTLCSCNIKSETWIGKTLCAYTQQKILMRFIKCF